MEINLIRSGGQGPGDDPPRMASLATTRIQGTILLDERVGGLREPLAEAGYEVVVIPADQRGTIPLLRPGKAPRLPILVTGKARDWLERNPDPVSLGVNLINVAAIVGHPEGCSTVLLRALSDPDIPVFDIAWMDFSSDGRRHLFLFIRE